MLSLLAATSQNSSLGKEMSWVLSVRRFAVIQEEIRFRAFLKWSMLESKSEELSVICIALISVWKNHQLAPSFLSLLPSVYLFFFTNYVSTCTKHTVVTVIMINYELHFIGQRNWSFKKPKQVLKFALLVYARIQNQLIWYWTFLRMEFALYSTHICRHWRFDIDSNLKFWLKSSRS